MESLERIVALFLLGLDPASPHADAADYTLDQAAECRLAADAFHQRLSDSPTMDAETLEVLVHVRDRALERMVALNAQAADALIDADDRARTRLLVLSEDEVLERLGDCAVAFGAVTGD